MLENKQLILASWLLLKETAMETKREVQMSPKIREDNMQNKGKMKKTNSPQAKLENKGLNTLKQEQKPQVKKPETGHLKDLQEGAKIRKESYLQHKGKVKKSDSP